MRCDDGNHNGDDCVEGCVPAACGDGFVHGEDEACDDGNAVENDACTGHAPARCGGWGVLGVEGCDDGNEADDDACTNVCQPARCGDGVVRTDIPDGDDGFERCDDGNEDTTDACADRQPARCGDGYVQAGVEACDDGNTGQRRLRLRVCHGCLRRRLSARGLEGCDDGNEANDDACPTDCTPAQCGDGFTRTDLSAGEEGFEGCDDANEVETDACRNGCVLATCGDGVLRDDLSEGEAGYESCDDGEQNTNAALASCSSDCAPVTCATLEGTDRCPPRSHRALAAAAQAGGSARSMLGLLGLGEEPKLMSYNP